MTHKILLEVAVPTPLTKPFNYLCPAGLTLPVLGARVIVPFGSRELTAMVTGHVTTLDDSINKAKLKAITKVLDDAPLQPPSFRQWLKWASNYYHYSLGEIYSQSWPALLRKGEAATLVPAMHFQLTQQGRATQLAELKRAKKQQQLLSHMHQHRFQQPHQLKEA